MMTTVRATNSDQLLASAAGRAMHRALRALADRGERSVRR
jgi:hypothetical protein